MTIAQTDKPTLRKPLRLWPGLILAALQPLFWFAVPEVFPEARFFGVLAAVACALGIALWWLFFSRAPWFDRLGALLLTALALYATSGILHISVATAGMGRMFVFLGVTLLTFVFALAVAATRRLAERPRRAVLAATILLASGGWALVRTGGVSMTGGSEFAWRWSRTPEEQLLARTKDEPASPVPSPAPAGAAAEPAKEPPTAKATEKRAEPPPAPAAATTPAEWPGFRGPNRDSIVRGVQVATDWSASPPVELWRRPIGPGWSSFAVHGDRLYTQEQRADDEIVACYNLTTGKPVWMRRDATRFWEANGGAGPRATPTLSKGRVYTFGATGILNALDATTGALAWSRNAASDTGRKVPYWGFSSSPLVVEDLVIIAAAGKLVAYDIATGNPRWFGPDGGGGYSSPHLLTIDGLAQILLLSGTGATSVAPADGTVLWEHKWPEAGGILQPALTADGDILITAAGMNGGESMRRVSVSNQAGGWSIKERWTSRGLKPYFNDFVVHKGHAYGFDGSILACIELHDGHRKWKGGRYGNGQLVLLRLRTRFSVANSRGR